MDIVTAIKDFGFPIVAAVGMLYMYSKQVSFFNEDRIELYITDDLVRFLQNKK